jgi:HAD superfamily hydrolase (TIGR01549 family)
MIEAVIFDVDGTLMDTVDMHAEAWQKAFREFGKELVFAAIRSQIGKGGDQLMPVFLNEKELAEIGEKIERRRGEIFTSEYLPKARPFPQVRELVARIKADGKRVVLASSATKEELTFFKQKLNIADLLAGTTSGDDAEHSKPEPDIFKAALEKLGAPAASRCIVVGDTPYDALAARKIDLTTIGVLCGGFSEESLRAAGCREIYRDPADLLRHYPEWAIAKAEAAERVRA